MSRVLVIGIDPDAVAHLGVDPGVVHSALAHGQARFDSAGIVAELCLVGLDQDRAVAQIVQRLEAHQYDCVVIGGGIRKPEPMLPFFEIVVNVVRQYAPTAAIAFNTTAENSVDAARRWLPATEPDAGPDR